MLKIVEIDNKQVLLDLDSMAIYAWKDISNLVVINPQVNKLDEATSTQVGLALTDMLANASCSLYNVMPFVSKQTETWKTLPVKATIEAFDKNFRLVKLTVQGVKNVVSYAMLHPNDDVRAFI